MSTIKQKKALELMVEKGRNNMGEIMREAGYSPNTALAPTKLTESKGWQELVEQYLPDDLLMKVHLEGLQASRKGSGEEADEVPDHAVRHRYLDTAFKIKNKYPVQKVDLTTMGEKIIGVNYVNPTETTGEADND